MVGSNNPNAPLITASKKAEIRKGLLRDAEALDIHRDTHHAKREGEASSALSGELGVAYRTVFEMALARGVRKGNGFVLTENPGLRSEVITALAETETPITSLVNKLGYGVLTSVCSKLQDNPRTFTITSNERRKKPIDPLIITITVSVDNLRTLCDKHGLIYPASLADTREEASTRRAGNTGPGSRP